ncbi:MAG: hypothetical protein HY940_03955 [Gammaproteobacteria bacterium]|nr:hypothetical protein [Gammaproteobacteria bacterium]
MKPFRSRGFLNIVYAVLLWPGMAQAAGDYPRWGFTPYLGTHAPQLTLLNDHVYQADLFGQANVLVYEGGQGQGQDANITETVEWKFESSVPRVGFTPVTGVEFEWQPNAVHSMVIGIGSWESTSQVRNVGNLPMQKYYVSNLVASTRRAKLSYTEYALGWRYNFRKIDRFRLYSLLSLHEIFDIDYQDEQEFLFLDSPIVDLIGIRRVMLVKAQTAALQALQLGVGGEWEANKSLSVGIAAGYMLGQDTFQLNNVKIQDDFLDNDGLTRLGMPYGEMAAGSLGYLAPGVTVSQLFKPTTRRNYYRPMPLNFDGWRLSAKITFYY